MSAHPLTHFDAQGQAHMVDVAAKAETHRVARASGVIRMQPATFDLIAHGQARKGDVIDHAVGIVLHARVGDHTSPGQPLLTIHANDEQKLAAARARLLAAYTWSTAPVAPPQLILRILDGQ